jgi:DNA replication licensing factor MCM2
LFPRYSDISKETFVRIRELPTLVELRGLRCEHIGHLIKIKGVVTKRTVVYPLLKVAYFSCTKCGEINGPFYYHGMNSVLNIGSCPMCQSNGPYKKETIECIYKNYQRITIQEPPGALPPGRVPRQKEIILTRFIVNQKIMGQKIRNWNIS